MGVFRSVMKVVVGILQVSELTVLFVNTTLLSNCKSVKLLLLYECDILKSKGKITVLCFCA